MVCAFSFILFNGWDVKRRHYVVSDGGTRAKLRECPTCTDSLYMRNGNCTVENYLMSSY